MKTKQIPVAENEKWLRIRVQFSQICDFGSRAVSERKMQNPAGVDSRSVAAYTQ